MNVIKSLIVALSVLLVGGSFAPRAIYADDQQESLSNSGTDAQSYSMAVPLQDNALQLQLTQRGLDAVAASLTSTLQQQLNQIAVPDFNEKNGSINVEARGLRGRVDLESTAIIAQPGQLVLQLKLKDVRVFADSLRFYRKVLGGKISTTCYETRISAGHRDLVNISAVIKPTIETSSLKLTYVDGNFSLAKDNYHVEGPRRCSGKLGVGYLISNIVKSLIVKSATPNRICCSYCYQRSNPTTGNDPRSKYAL